MANARLIIAVAAALCLNCAEIQSGILAVDEALYEAVPVHPVTGRPMASLVSEDEEIQLARDSWARIEAAARRGGYAVDPPGPRLSQVHGTFSRLTAVAHRQHLPWEVHLIRHPTVNAMTPGGGMVFVFEGIYADFGKREGFVGRGNDEIAAVLAHEIAHVTLMHMAEMETARIFTDRHTDDPYYAASYSTADEEEADKLGVLYLALAGFDPLAASRVWQRAHSKFGSDPGSFLYTHPLNTQRLQATAAAAAQVMPYYSPGRQNPIWATILHDNPLFPRRAATGRAPGAGIARGLEAALEARERHEDAKSEADQREAAASMQLEAARVQLLQTWTAYSQAKPYVWMRFHNGASRATASIEVRVTYWRGSEAVAQDEDCGGPASIQPNSTVDLACDLYDVAGATGISAEIFGVRFE